MDRIINVKVGGNYLSKDNKNAGVRGEANVTKLRISFDEGWDNFAKSVTFWNARGANPVQRILTTDLLENISENTRVYLVPIPAEPMAEAGTLTFVIDGYTDGKIQRSFADKLEVKDAPITDNAEEPADPTPTQAEQLQTQIDGIMNTIQGAVISEQNAKSSETNAKTSEINAKTSEDGALNSLNQAKVYAEDAEMHSNNAQNAVGKTSYIGDNGNWFAWDSKNNTFYDTGIRAQSGSEVYVGNNPPASADVWVDLNGESYIYAPYIGDNGNWYTFNPETQTFEDSGNKATWTGKDTEAVKNYIDEQTATMKADIEGIQEDIRNEAHFRGYLSTNAKIQALEATPNDYAYSAESGTKWVYDAESGWINTGTPVPDQLTPASETTPLINGEASVGTEQAYARGDHRHPTDTTRASVEALNKVKTELETDIDDCVKDANCELIEEITITEEAIKYVVRNAEPDGTPYNFKEVTVYTEVKPCNVQNLVQIKVFDYYADSNGADNIAGYQASNTPTTSGRFLTAHFGVYGGSWQAIGTATTIQGSPTNVQMWRYVNPYKKGQTIKSVLVYGNTTDLEVGTVIRIYGVRA